jgi:hypothetical protein
MSTSAGGVVTGPTMVDAPGRQLVGALLGAVVGAVLWLLLSIPQDLINVICSVLIGIGAGVGAGRLSGAIRSGLGSILAVMVAAVVLLVTQAIITRYYLSWATDNLPGAPSNPSWDGPIGAMRLALDRAGARHGWTPNASYFYWFVSLACAAALSWYTARPLPRGWSR